jgi:hypothetical protein
VCKSNSSTLVHAQFYQSANETVQEFDLPVLIGWPPKDATKDNKANQDVITRHERRKLKEAVQEKYYIEFTLRIGSTNLTITIEAMSRSKPPIEARLICVGFR